MVKIGLIGFGTVGSGIVDVLRENGRYIFEKTGVEIKLAKVADIDISRDRGVAIDKTLFTKDPFEIINDPSISIVVEAIGGTDPALKYVTASIENGKNVVTSNKELIAKHGSEIFNAARKKNVRVLFEGSVGGGIPIINQLRTSLSGNIIEEVFGIVNGTTNYILTKMTHEDVEFEVALKEAQQKGFAEADPKNDIEGYDASYKAAILASVSFLAKIDWTEVYFEGINKIALEDIKFAKELGYVIKLLAVAKRHADGIEVRVHPTLIEKDHPLANVNEAFNAIYVRGNACGEVMFYGKGAGSRPTASAVISDIVEISRCETSAYYPAMTDIKVKNIREIESRYYIRLKAKDMPGVLAGIAGAFGEKNVSIQSALQKETIDNIATIVIITHKVKEKNVFEALEMISKQPKISLVGNVIRVGME